MVANLSDKRKTMISQLELEIKMADTDLVEDVDQQCEQKKASQNSQNDDPQRNSICTVWLIPDHRSDQLQLTEKR